MPCPLISHRTQPPMTPPPLLRLPEQTPLTRLPIPSNTAQHRPIPPNTPKTPKHPRTPPSLARKYFFRPRQHLGRTRICGPHGSRRETRGTGRTAALCATSRGIAPCGWLVAWGHQRVPKGRGWTVLRRRFGRWGAERALGARVRVRGGWARLLLALRGAQRICAPATPIACAR